MAISVGGFFANLSLKSDKESFDRSKKDLKELDAQTRKTGEDFESFTKGAIKGLLALGAAALGSSYAVSNIQAKMELTATKAGMGYTEFNKFSSALKLVGVDSANVANKMASVNSALNDFKVGKNSEALGTLAKNLALMGIDLKNFASLNPSQQLALIAKKAEEARGTDKEVGMRDLADEIAGLGDTLMAIQQKGSQYQNFAALMSAGAGATWSSNQSDVTKNSQAFNSFKLQLDQMWKSAGESVGTTFRPIIVDLTDFLRDHKDEIKQFFADVSRLLSDMVTLLGPVVKTLAETTGAAVGLAASGSRAMEQEKKDPEQARRLLLSLTSSQSRGLYEDSLWNMISKPKEQRKGTVSDAENIAFAMEAQGAKYASSVSEAGRKAAGISNTATTVSIGNIMLSGTDFNQFVNYMQANPGANKYSVAAAALAATNNLAGTK